MFIHRRVLYFVVMKRWLAGAFLLIGFGVHAQNFYNWQYNDRYFSLAAGTGMSTYFGELNDEPILRKKLSNLSLGVEARLLSRLGARAEVIYYTLQEDDHNAADSSFARQRNLNFRSRNIEGNLQAILYLRKYNGDYFRRWSADPYLGFGVGVTSYNPTTVLDSVRYDLREFETEGEDYGKYALVLPVTMGLKFRFNEFINMIAEVSYRYTFTDYLDDVSTVFRADDGSIAARLSNRKRESRIGGEIAIINQEFFDSQVEGAARGNPNTNDSYLFINFKLEIFLPRKNGGPILSKPSAY